jgi:MSHA biogenesis protein MshQ
VQNFSCSLAGLQCNTTYYFRATGSSSAGTASGVERSFTTGSCSVTPTVNKLDAVEVSGAPLSSINTKLAGVNFSLDVLGLTSGDLVDSSYSRTVTPVLVDASSSGACATMTAVSGATVTPASATYAGADAGRKAFTFNSSQAAANVRVRMTDNSTPALTQCSTDAFAIRPASFTITSTNANADNTGTSISATPAIKAGSTNFSLTASSGVVGYNGTPVLDVTKRAAHTGAVQNGTLAGSFAAATANNGQASGAAFTYSEVGYFKLLADAVTDATFTAIDSASGGCTAGSTSNVLASGKYGCLIGSAASNHFGRFYPDRFTMVTSAVGSVSGAARTFFYMGEAFRVSTTIEARNSSDALTRNYTGSFAKGSPAAAAEDSNNGTNLAVNLTWTTPLGAWSGGVYTLNDANVVYARNSTTPAAPLAALAIGIQIVDADGPVLAARDMNPVTNASDAQCAPAALTNCTFKTIGTTAFRYGQMVLFPTYGSEMVTLAAPVELQYWNGSAFVLNGADSTTTLTAGMRQQRQRRRVMPGAVTQHGIGRRFHAGAGALDAGRSQAQGASFQPVVFFPDAFLDGMRPAQRDRLAERRQQQAGGEAEGAHASLSATAAQDVPADEEEQAAKPSSSVSGRRRPAGRRPRPPRCVPRPAAACAGSRWRRRPTGRWPAGPCRRCRRPPAPTGRPAASARCRTPP